RAAQLLLPLRDGVRHPAPQRRGAGQAGFPRQAHQLRALAAFAFASVAAAAAPAPVAFTSEDAQLLAASARSHPRDMANQATVDVSRKLGAAGNLEALDYMLQLGHPMMVATWTSGFRESNRDRLSPEIEERLVRVYDDD